MRTLVTGGAGFIGSHLTEWLLKQGHEVVVFDNFVTGSYDNTKHLQEDPNFTLVEADLLDLDKVINATQEIKRVFHLAANPDARVGVYDTKKDLQQNILVTHNVLEGMRINKVKEIVFTSSSVVYGEPDTIPTPEDYGPLIPISLYGASKLACEALISAYSHIFDMRCWILRFANVIGGRSNHGVLYDFMNKLKSNKNELEILGDGNQTKSYLLVEDCIDAMFYVTHNTRDPINIFNIGTGDQISVKKIAEVLIKELKLGDVKLKFQGGKRGWRGDVTKMLLSIEKINQLGWRPNFNSEEAVIKTAQHLKQTFFK